MAVPSGTRKVRPRLRRDNQQWLFDWVVKETGKVFHFQGDGRGALPKTVRSHAMISKHTGQSARRLERLAKAEADVGHRETALDFYFRAALQFMAAQHPIFEVNEEKQYLHSSGLRCYDEVRKLAPYTLEHVDIPWNGTVVSGNLHLAPVTGPAPLVFFIPGCDQTKESWPNPMLNHAHQRGMHVFSFDGPGQGENNLRGTRLTSDNYEQAARAAIDYLVTRPEIDASKIGIHGHSFGSFWGLRVAATDSRVAAVCAPAATYCDKYYLMNEESPRYKQLFGFLTQAESEDEIDAIADAMTLQGYMDKITAPTLLMCGEYDPRSPLEDIYQLYDQVSAPKELWVFADQFHGPTFFGSRGAVWEADLHMIVCDWLRDRFAGKAPVHSGEVIYIEGSSAGPYSSSVSLKRHWYE